MSSLPLPIPLLLLLLLLLLACLVSQVEAHARLMEPPSRASMWRLGYDNPPDFNDHQGFCGGFKHQFGRMGGQCGICGDPADAWPRQHEAPGGRFANGLITRQYKPGQDIVVKELVTGFIRKLLEKREQLMINFFGNSTCWNFLFLNLIQSLPPSPTD